MEMVEQKHNIFQISKELLELLKSKGYSTGTLNNYRRALDSIALFMKERKMTEYTEGIGEAYFDDHISNWKIKKSRQKQIQTLLRRLGEFKNGVGYRLIKPSPVLLIPLQYVDILKTYLAFCASHGNKETTIAAKRSFCSRFLCYLVETGCEDITSINTNNICKACLKFVNKDAFAVVRLYLGYLYKVGILNFDYSVIVPKYQRSQTLPVTYTTSEIHRLEDVVESCAKHSDIGKRDHAALLLATRVGMRSGDIIRLKFENIDFACDRIHLTQEKTGQPISLPLLPEIRLAILEYLQNARPSVESDFLFLRENAPFERMTTSAMRYALTGYFMSAHIDISGKKHGVHTLRASLASSMVNNDVPYEVVRKVLGHTDPQAVRHYAKVDLENLRLYAIDVPTPSGIFAKILQGRKQLW